MIPRYKLHELLGKLPSRVKIGTRYVGPGEPVFIIAEAGINHNGSVDLAKKLIDAAVEAGVDAIKFQKRTTKDILTKDGLDKPYNSPNAFAPTYGEHRDALEFGEPEYQVLTAYAKEKGILMFASVWDKKSADFIERFDMAAYKIPSADVTNVDLLAYVAQKNRPILLSTGMSTEEEIEDAVKAILQHNTRLILFHCVSLYPCKPEILNMRYMQTLRKRYKPLPVGYSGHETDLLPTLAAVARDAVIVERHLTLDKTMKGSDHSASLDPQEFKELVRSIREIEKVLGKDEKILYPELLPLREKLGKSVVSAVEIPKGTRITEKMLMAKGPGNGISPAKLKSVVGIIAQETIPADKVLPLEVLKWPRG
jgi:sialic acid synthase SpsE